MSETHDLTFVEKKSRDVENPYAVLKGIAFGGEAEFRILKKNTKYLQEEYASVLVAASSPATFGSFDIGDTYVADIVNFNLTEVDGREPTQEEFAEWAALRGHLESNGWENHNEVFTLTEIGNGARPTPRPIGGGVSVTEIAL